MNTPTKEWKKKSENLVDLNPKTLTCQSESKTKKIGPKL